MCMDEIPLKESPNHSCMILFSRNRDKQFLVTYKPKLGENSEARCIFAMPGVIVFNFQHMQL